MRHVVITGASSGLGSALARLYAGAGASLTLAGRDAERLAGVSAACRAATGACVREIVCDVRDGPELQTQLLAADNALPVDLVIANAGIGGAGVLAPPGGESRELAEQILGINMQGAVNTVTPLIGRMRDRRRGHIVLVSSVAAFQGLPDAPVYCASKAALGTYGAGLRRLLAPQGISVTVVNPGFVETPMSASLPMTPLFAISAEDAARRIAKAAARRKAELTFPWQMRLYGAAARVLPTVLLDPMLRAGSAWTERR